MRRSCAPSVQGSAKRLRFIPVHSEKENKIFDVTDFEINDLKENADEKSASNSVSSTSCFVTSVDRKQDNTDVLNLLFNPIDNDEAKNRSSRFLQYDSESIPEVKSFVNNEHHLNEKTTSVQIVYYSVLWCKRSSKKHKIWEGDGILIISGRSAVLKDTDGSVIDRCVGYKLKEVEMLEDGSRFYIGGKECEIQNQIDSSEVQSLLPKGTSVSTNEKTKDSQQDLDCAAEKLHKSRNIPNVSALKKKNFSSVKDSPPTPALSNTSSCKSNEDVLKLIDEALFLSASDDPQYTSVQPDSKAFELKHSNGDSSNVNKDPVSCMNVNAHTEVHEEKTFNDISQCEESDKVELIYSVMWCKQSGKKHKTWEGDGTLVIKGRSAILKNAEGKIIDRGIGYKLKDITSLEEGSRFYIGGKQCEIQCLLSTMVLEESLENDSITSIKHRKFYSPLKEISLKPVKHFDFPKECGLILPEPSEDNQAVFNAGNLPITEVRVDGFLSNLLRPHQKEGIIFLYKCILGFQHEYGQGAILADEMGLGKTLQCIALIWTLFKKGPFGGKPVLKRSIIITPSSLVMNWKKEFKKWLGDSRLGIHAIDKKNTVKDFVKNPKDVLIISYEMFLRSAEVLSPISFDLVICDEGHRIKNLNIKISNVINCLSTNRRILLTGTPIQNDLAEFFSLVDFVNPGALGSIQSFRRQFERPISLSRDQNCTEEEKETGEEQSEELNKISGLFMLRRTQEVINQYLPSKSEMVIFCRPSELQRNVYTHLLDSASLWSILSGVATDPSQHLVYISLLRKLCNHPALLYSQEEMDDNNVLNCVQSIIPSNYQWSPTDSGKMKVLEKILKSLFSSHKREKVVIVSNFTQTLNLLEEFCKNKNYYYLRLDGSTITSSRQDLVDTFNKSYTKYSVFLLSSKAGGVGFNLIGASRIVLYDIDWNPAHDLQAMARIWRDGQKHAVHIYRLLTTGTIEEKIYQRQLSKQCLSGSVLNPNTNEKLKFSRDELRDLFTFHGDTDCLTHDIINCHCLESTEDDSVEEMQEADKPKNIGMEELLNWTHLRGSFSQDEVSDYTLGSCGSDISFLFMNKTNSPK